MSQLWILTEGHQPVVAVALHDGHDVRSEVKQFTLRSKTIFVIKCSYLTYRFARF
jgi:hypothetical protein